MVCPRCGSSVSPTDHFCENCGCPLTAERANGGLAAAQACHCPAGQSQPDEGGYCQVCGARCVSEAVAAREHVEVSIDGRLAVVSDIGRRHPSNEDTGAVARGPGDSVVLVVADGVSRSSNAASASEAAVGAALGSLLSAPADTALAEAVRAAVGAANQAVLALPLGSGDEDGPETTIVVALCRDGRVAVGWAGDSRAYVVDLVGPGSAELLTVDDSWVEDVVRRGELSREQAEADPRVHYVTQVLGMRDQQLQGHLVERELPSNFVLLLCSDGLWNYIERRTEFVDALRRQDSQQDSQQDSHDALSLCRWFVDMANARGGHDNVTVAVLMGSLT